jgi:predicted ferric reductase
MIAVLCVLHNSTFVFVGIGLWLIDLFMRLILICIYKKKIKKATITNLPGNIIRLVFEMNPNESFRYKAGQYICICIPAISWFEWHPLSISSSPYEEEFALHFSAIGSWTQKIKKEINLRGKILKHRKKNIERKNTNKSNSSKQSMKKKETLSIFRRGNTAFSNQSKVS